LKQDEGGLTVAEVCRQHNVSDASFYAWKSKFGGMSVSDAQKLRTLEAENAKLKRVVADLTLDKLALQDVIAKKLEAR
jgi:putative transposase